MQEVTEPEPEPEPEPLDMLDSWLWQSTHHNLPCQSIRLTQTVISQINRNQFSNSGIDRNSISLLFF